MNKFQAFTLTFIFAFFAIPGFLFGKQAAEMVYSVQHQKQLQNSVTEVIGTPVKFATAEEFPRPTSTPQKISMQEQILLIQADNLTNKNSRLVSVWGVFISHSSPSGLVFKAIDPSLTSSTFNETLHSTYHLTADGNLSPEFLSSFDSLGVNWDGYILVDQAFIHSLASLQNSLPSIPVTTLASYSKNRMMEEAAFLQQICRTIPMIQEGSLANPSDIFNFGPHFQTNLDPQQIQSGWENILSSGTAPMCETITEP